MGFATNEGLIVDQVPHFSTGVYGDLRPMASEPASYRILGAHQPEKALFEPSRKGATFFNWHESPRGRIRNYPRHLKFEALSAPGHPTFETTISLRFALPNRSMNRSPGLFGAF